MDEAGKVEIGVQAVGFHDAARLDCIHDETVQRFSAESRDVMRSNPADAAAFAFRCNDNQGSLAHASSASPFLKPPQVVSSTSANLHLG
jgi:hypothetical protein